MTRPRIVRLINARDATRPFVAARLRRDCAADVLDVVERDWALARQQLAGVVSLEHAHWDWRNKSNSVRVGHHCLTVVECEGEIQGLVALARNPRAGTLSRNHVLYVDYLEVAPWNLRVATTTPRFIGVGTALMVDAIRLSWEQGQDGRVGLYSLPQAESFYARCGLTRIGLDPNYYDLVYYECTGPQALSWLASIGEQL